ncbi:hypothetical protein MAPG_02155 [Magnaporthiopsis poae ATCC 64411]|uniref:Uncharacterized protein n=1 Tax=Magnaporthiopsis poae (strain ATCC 64411 / 73-15) TaxID=644358 RepID=A0A0C4DQL1_MAGP6|nr:hypothetical protein MAPG_02155 [Magnaporthiopsis poae ATCC 64411]
MSLYIYAPRFDVAAESGTAPRLGSIFEDLVKLTGALNRGNELPVPKKLRNELSVPNLEVTFGKKVGGKVGLYAGLVQSVLGGISTEHAYTTSEYHSISCQRLRTTEFEAEKEFVRESIENSQKVQNHFINKKRAYMITGLKVGTGFAATHRSGAEGSHDVGAEVNANSVGVPASAGTKLGVTAGSSHEVTHGPASREVVVAYRAIVIKRKRNGELQISDNFGKQFCADDDSDDDDDDEEWDLEPVDEEYVLKHFADEDE